VAGYLIFGRLSELESADSDFALQRGGQLIKKWGRSSAASTAVSIADAMKSLLTPTPEGDWFSSGVWSEGNPYGIAQDLVFSMPCRSQVRCPGQAALYFDFAWTPFLSPW
jgi:hypothetical protein